jgi:enoyl-CoA hydratase/carnithine racemase
VNDVLVERPREGVAVVTLNRPDRLNAVKPSTIPLLVEAFDGLGADESVAAIVLTGAGRGFCAGVDLSAREEWPEPTPKATTVFMRDVHQAGVSLSRLPQPVIAAVNGPAAGGGFGYALACDLRIAAPTATFVASFARLGLGPDCGLSHTLPRIVGTARALEVLLTAATLTADEALALGLVSRVADDALAAAVELATSIAALPTRVSRSIKQTLARSADADLVTALLDIEASAQAELFSDPGLAAGLSKAAGPDDEDRQP